MSEVSSPGFMPEERPQTSAAYNRIAMLTSDVVFDQAAEEILASVSSEEVQRYRDLRSAHQASTNSYREAIRAENYTEAEAHRADLDTAIDEISDMPHIIEEAVSAAERLRGEYPERNLRADSIEAQAIQDMLNNAPKIQPPNNMEAPFRSYAQNTDQAWQRVPTEEVQAYLSNRIFFDTYQRRLNAGTAPRLRVTADRHETLTVPLDMIVNVAGFDSWEGRRGATSYKDVSGKYSKAYDQKVHSSELTKHYAGLPSELPAVEHISLYIQPDGVIFGDNGEGDSHRITAAVLRGDEIIQAHSISIRCLDKNWITPQPSVG